MGDIAFDIDGHTLTPIFIPEPTRTKRYDVDARLVGLIELPAPISHPTTITFSLYISGPYTSGPASGENLSLIEFINENTVMCVGFEGDIAGVQYLYTENGVRITVTEQAEISSIPCAVAWKYIGDIEHDRTQTWLAADPCSP